MEHHRVGLKFYYEILGLTGNLWDMNGISWEKHGDTMGIYWSGNRMGISWDLQPTIITSWIIQPHCGMAINPFAQGLIYALIQETQYEMDDSKPYTPCFSHDTYNPASQMTHRQDHSLPIFSHNWGIECQARV